MATGSKKWKNNDVREILDWAKDMQLNSGKMKNILLLDQEQDGRATCFLATKSGIVKILEEMWVLAKQKGNPKEIK